MTAPEIQNRRASGFLENGFGSVLASSVALIVTHYVALIGGTAQSPTATLLVDAAMHIGIALMILQCCFEIVGRESILLRGDWQRFGCAATGLGFIASGGAFVTSLVPLLLT